MGLRRESGNWNDAPILTSWRPRLFLGVLGLRNSVLHFLDNVEDRLLGGDYVAQQSEADFLRDIHDIALARASQESTEQYIVDDPNVLYGKHLLNVVDELAILRDGPKNITTKSTTL